MLRAETGTQQAETQGWALEGTQSPSCPAGRGNVLSAPLQQQSLPIPPAPPHRASWCVPVLGPAPHGHCTLSDCQVFLSGQIKQFAKTENFYIGLFAKKVGQWKWVDKTPYNETAA